jgi:hypothetical protein
MATPLYARYIPPRKAVVSKQLATDQQHIQKSPSPPPPIVGELKRKKADRTEPKKPKKRKSPAEDEVNYDIENEKFSKRHETVFAKFNRAAIISEKIKERHAQEPEEPNGIDDPPILHGQCINFF